MSRQDQPPPQSPHADVSDAADTPVVSTFAPGDLLCDRFRVVRFIARGGMGELYEAEDLELRERVALKAIRPEIAADERVNQRFRREVQLARKVTHPNICRIFDLFQHQPGRSSSRLTSPVLFVTMELLEGETLAQRLKRHGRYTAGEALPIVRQMAEALAAAHAAGIVHRDFKSSNVMLLAPPEVGDEPRVVVTDFGIAFRLGEAAVPAGTRTSAASEMLGTPEYMAPEQLEGSEVTAATDIYALGIVLYEMVAGTRPFAADTPIASAIRRISGPAPRAPRDLAPDLPPAWNSAILRCLARYPANRFPDAASVIRALGREPAAGEHTTSWRMAVAIVVGLLALTAAGAQIWSDVRGAPGAEDTSVSVPAPRRSVAVLGFRNLASREDASWLSTALGEMLTTELGAGEALRTIPGENIDRMKVELVLGEADSYGAETLARIGQHLGSDLVVFGSYVTVGEGADTTLRIDIRLQDSREGQTLSLVSESGPASDLLDLVSRAGQRLRERLGVDALPAGELASARASQPASAEAARLYAEGLSRLRRFDALAARDLLERAAAVDPGFPLAHSALASAWAALGYDLRARESAERAYERSASLSRAERLVVEGTFREMASAWPEAITIWQTLSTFFPDDVEYALRLANAQIASGAAKEGLATVERFRQQFPAAADPRLALAEAGAAETLSDFKRMEAAAATAVAAGQQQGARLLVAGARLREGSAVLRQGDSLRALSLFEEARRLYEDAGDRAGVARTLNNLATALSDGGETQRVVSLYEEGLTIARAVGDQHLTARLLNNLAVQHRRAGRLQASLQMNQEALAIRREIGDRTNEAVSLNNIGNVLLDLSDLAGATRHYEESARMSREIGDRRAVARALHNAAEALRLQGEVARARETGEEALGIRRGIDEPASVATSLHGLGHAFLLQGDLPEAKRLLGEALAIERQLDRWRPVAYVLYQLGEVAFVEGDLAEATRWHEEALDIRLRLGETGTSAESRMALAAIALERAQFAEAERLALDAAAVFEQQGASDNEAVARALLAQAMAAQGRPRPARSQIDRARALVRDSQNVLARLPVQVAAARLDAGGGNASAALRALQEVRDEAARRGLVRTGFEARRAIAELDTRSATSVPDGRAALEADARARGFLLFARR